jgi:hypothetical protein
MAMKTAKTMRVLELALEMGSRWAEVDYDAIEGAVPQEAPPATEQAALEVLTDFSGLDAVTMEALSPAVRQCAALLCLEARRERWAKGFGDEVAS